MQTICVMSILLCRLQKRVTQDQGETNEQNYNSMSYCAGTSRKVHIPVLWCPLLGTELMPCEHFRKHPVFICESPAKRECWYFAGKLLGLLCCWCVTCKYLWAPESKLDCRCDVQADCGIGAVMFPCDQYIFLLTPQWVPIMDGAPISNFSSELFTSG